MLSEIRGDAGMPELLRYENIAWFEDGVVRMLDRRIYPMEVRYEICRTPEEVALAIRNMVTQSGGPLLASQMGMVLAANQMKGLSQTKAVAYLQHAADVLGTARPTTSAAMQSLTSQSFKVALAALDSGSCPVDAVFQDALQTIDARYASIEKQAKFLVDTFPAHGTVMTQCFAETIVGKMGREIRNQKKDIRFICPETRPYLQGARLTASVLSDLGFSVHVITDNMPAAIMQRESVDIFTSAADVITGDLHVINKVGTFQIALAASHFGIPYYVSGHPSTTHATPETVTIEERNPLDVLSWLGKRVAKPSVQAFYPAFDITPPSLVTGVITDTEIIYPMQKYQAIT